MGRLTKIEQQKVKAATGFNKQNDRRICEKLGDHQKFQLQVLRDQVARSRAIYWAGAKK